MGRVAGKVALITGGASGLGLEDARFLAREGGRVVITDVQDEQGEKLAAEIPGALYLNHDVRDEQRWHEVVERTVEHFGRLDVLINNAGLVRFASVEDLSYADYKLQVEVMLDGTFLGCRAALPAIARSGGGSIVNMASIGGMKGISTIPAYAAAKGGIISMTRSIAVHCQEQGYRIRCNSIAPGGISTPMTTQAVAALDADDPGLKQNRDFGMGVPADVANLVLFLASDESRHITGTNMVIDNGETIN
ncbi:SDR family oxidoreductase [Novosphingobium sp. ST904]|jgi:3(or 17)beta-hydroxysteroid dehydrogenase|uniref:SDR family oxidoreductase n=1 Tax=Novosphingobium sp. ST904 TaxID=1684385 RepID=UPI0006C85908|nr:SDR family oxidoreductase [Novosphingobium sp. ST904]KPH68167.1 short-chain dehydrogenase [Novosphingobium sp. ST904]TCM23693.1 3(or 17)beta-hydroxysteroid dehydrogenase [Novosphingobium sp. ST904]